VLLDGFVATSIALQKNEISSTVLLDERNQSEVAAVSRRSHRSPDRRLAQLLGRRCFREL